MILNQPIFQKIVQEVEAGRSVVLCVVVAKRGSTPQSPGAMLLVDQGMNAIGTLGGGCAEAETRKQAFELLNRGESKLLTLRLDDDHGWDDGLICGGSMDVAIQPIVEHADAEPFQRALADIADGRSAEVPLRVMLDGRLQEYRVLVEAEPRLIIAGAGHIGAELARMCNRLEFDVTVIDDRADMLDPKRIEPPIRTIAGDIADSLRKHPIDKSSYVVIVTRGHRHDEQALAAVIDTPAKYIGMIGSRRKIKMIFDNLIAAGAAREQLDRVHTPIGVDIRAITVPEIAVSIAAQLIATRRADHRRLVQGPLPL